MNRINQENPEFIDTLKKEGDFSFSQKILRNSIYQPSFYLEERKKAAQKKTIVFDLDETLRGWDEKKHLAFLRDFLPNLLDNLKARYRLVIWSAATKASIQQTLNRYPHFEYFFDCIIAAENYSMPFMEKEDVGYLKEADKKYFRAMRKDFKNKIDEKTGKSILRPPKNLHFLGYELLVDDDSRALKEAKTYGFKSLQIFPYKYLNPGRGLDLPQELIETVERDFKENMLQRIVDLAEGKKIKKRFFLFRS